MGMPQGMALEGPLGAGRSAGETLLDQAEGDGRVKLLEAGGAWNGFQSEWEAGQMTPIDDAPKGVLPFTSSLSYL